MPKQEYQVVVHPEPTSSLPCYEGETLRVHVAAGSAPVYYNAEGKDVPDYEHAIEPGETANFTRPLAVCTGPDATARLLVVQEAT
jgi:hypothetical protein